MVPQGISGVYFLRQLIQIYGLDAMDLPLALTQEFSGPLFQND
jgi:hypothetical protein